MHSPEQMKKKEMARAEAMHHMHNSAVDGPSRDMKMDEKMENKPSNYEKSMEEGC